MYSALVVQTRLKPYLEAIELVIDEGGVSFDTTALAAELSTRKGANESAGFTDLVELIRYATPTLTSVGFDAANTLRNWVDALAPESVIRAELAAMGFVADPSQAGTEADSHHIGSANADAIDAGGGSDVIFGLSGADVLNGGAGNDTIHGGGDNDQLQGGDGSDTLLGEAGNDTLRGGRGTNTLDGGDGDDILIVDVVETANTLLGGAGDDNLSATFWSYNTTFEGGTGNDTIVGAYNGDTYRFNLGDGSDTISDHQWYTVGGMHTDCIVFGAGISPADMTAQRSGNDMLFKHANGTDQLRVQGWYATNGEYVIERVEFVDGTVWLAPELSERARPVYGTEGNDTIYGGVGVNIIDGGAGDDVLGNNNTDTTNTLRGGAGNDTLSANYWSTNTYEGGAGNDTITGAHGADTYRFDVGDGSDTITDQQWYSQAGINDRIVFGAGIAAADIVAQRSGNDMLFKHANGTDQLRMLNWYHGNQYVIERVEFADGTVWLAPELSERARPVYGTEGNDTIYGGVGVNIIDGGAGDDVLGNNNTDTTNTLRGGAGNDTLSANYWSTNTYEGGAGNDTITGAHGADAYLFNLGDGSDTISDYQWYSQAGINDRIVLGAGIAAADIVAQRSGNDMLFKHANGTDQLRMQNWYHGSQYVIERVEFADGTVRLSPELSESARPVYGTEGNDTIAGGAGVNIIDGGAGDDVIYNDNVETTNTLRGGAGNDSLSVTYWTNPNAFEGGTGNDTMTGAHYGDTYRFNIGDGSDLVIDHQSYTVGGFTTDRIVFGAGIAPADIVAQRSGNEMLFKHVNGTDQLRVQNWFASTSGQYFIERVEFAEGTAWNSADLTAAALVVVGTGAADTLAGTGFADTLYGMAGDDTLTAVGSGDTLDGGDGDDTFYVGIESGATLLGGAGNDLMRADIAFWTYNSTFVGGTGNDTLRGGYNADTYVFNLGDGSDTISDHQWYTTGGMHADRIVFGAGVAAADIGAQRSGNDMLFKHVNGTDQIRVQNWYVNNEYVIERVEFADGTVWTNAHATGLAGNQSPAVAAPIADQSATEDAVFSFVVPAEAFADPDAGTSLLIRKYLT